MMIAVAISSQMILSLRMNTDLGEMVGNSLTMRAPTTASHAAVGNWAVEASTYPSNSRKIGSSASNAPAGAGTPTKCLLGSCSAADSSAFATLKRAKSQAATDREDEHEKPAGASEIHNQRLEHQQPRGDAETQEIREEVELGAQIARRLQPPGEKAVEPVGQRGEHDQPCRETVVAADSEPDRSQPGA